MNSSESTKELISEISSYLRKNRGSLPDEAVRLLEEVRDDLQRIRADPPESEIDLKAMLTRVSLRLIRFFAKSERLEEIEQITDDLGSLC
jgi:hypothetical protein